MQNSPVIFPAPYIYWLVWSLMDWSGVIHLFPTRELGLLGRSWSFSLFTLMIGIFLFLLWNGRWYPWKREDEGWLGSPGMYMYMHVSRYKNDSEQNYKCCQARFPEISFPFVAFPTWINIPTTGILTLCVEVLRPWRAICLLWVGWQAHKKGCHLAWFPQVPHLARVCHISHFTSQWEEISNSQQVQPL